ncbi:VOC family protein [Skermanella mucosa]|uniref:VOC family protein n=1 Tax=Skermanella mucosa TaxID=1789672 RepID=UPI001E3D95FE|nr:VOC family protein [Skermanella mucosa]UEM23327.1 VOC family protein [Skermanella mucosa]
MADIDRPEHLGQLEDTNRSSGAGIDTGERDRTHEGHFISGGLTSSRSGIMSTSPSIFVWHELMTDDTESAIAFYRAVVGWNSQDWGEPGAYTLVGPGEERVAGIMPLPEEARAAGGRPAWLGYIGVADVDAATVSLVAAGGRVWKQPSDIPEVGRFSVVADPQGAVFMLFKPTGGNRPAASDGAPGHVGWNELCAVDWEQAFDFYSGQFGWTKADGIDMGLMGIYQLFSAGGAPIGGMMNKPEAMPVPAWIFYFNVPEIDAAVARVMAGGGQILNGPMEVPGGSWIVNCVDPQGAMFSLVAPAR